jgi:xanthine dehydrogenase YagT iron-sulfur-binding subunit
MGNADLGSAASGAVPDPIVVGILLPLTLTMVPHADEHVVELELAINGERHRLEVDVRTTLLDLLREHVGLSGSKKGCDHGQCGACTVLIDGRRANACLVLAVTLEGREVTTIEGLAGDGQLHRLQAAFLDHDAFQCGYCTPGQICSGVGMLAEARAGIPSWVTKDLTASVQLDEDEIRERMSGNLCRCAAYVNIVSALLEVAGEGAAPVAEAAGGTAE